MWDSSSSAKQTNLFAFYWECTEDPKFAIEKEVSEVTYM